MSLMKRLTRSLFSCVRPCGNRRITKTECPTENVSDSIGSALLSGSKVKLSTRHVCVCLTVLHVVSVREDDDDDVLKNCSRAEFSTGTPPALALALALADVVVVDELAIPR